MATSLKKFSGMRTHHNDPYLVVGLPHQKNFLTPLIKIFKTDPLPWKNSLLSYKNIHKLMKELWY